MFTNEEQKLVAEEVYQAWRAGDTSFDGNWFMVKLDDSVQKLFEKRVENERSSAISAKQ